MSDPTPDEPLDWKTYVVTVLALNAFILLMMYLVISLLQWGA